MDPLSVEAWQILCGEVEPGQVLDIREPDAFSRGHIPGAINLPYGEVQARAVTLLDRARPVLVVDPGGARAAEMAVWLRGEGFAARYLEGGMGRWTGPLDRVRRNP